MLRVPKGTPIFAPLMADPADGWELLDMVEVPAGSGRLYVITMVDDAHSGFVNHYRVGILSQVGNVGNMNPMGAGSALVLVTTAGHEVDEYTAGSALELATSGPTGAGEFHAGSALVLLAVPPGAVEEYTAGSALELATSGPTGAGEFHAGSALVFKVVPPGAADEFNAGSALEFVVVVSGGSVTPGTSCLGAAAITLPYTATHTVPAGGTHWFTFTAANVLHHVRSTVPSGTYAPGSANTGACGAQTQLTITDNITTCRTFTPAAGTVWIRVDGSFFGAITYTLDVGTGSC